MAHFYRVFGLTLRTNQLIPGLHPIEALKFDVELFLNADPGPSIESENAVLSLIYSSSTRTESGEPVLRVSRIRNGSPFRVDYYDGVTFWLNGSGDKVWAIWPESSSIEDVATYLLGPMLGFLLRLRGITCLHASAVAFGNSAVAFAGMQGAGKSTTAAALARRGHPVISDDIVALTERDGIFHVVPAYPYLSLWPESVDLLYGSRDALPAFSKNWEKRQLALSESQLNFATQPLPLSAIYLLSQRTADPNAPFIDRPAPSESLLSLVADTYATNLIDKEMRIREFELLGRLLTSVPIFRLHPHEDGTRIDQLCELVERTGTLHVHSRTASRP